MVARVAIEHDELGKEPIAASLRIDEEVEELGGGPETLLEIEQHAKSDLQFDPLAGVEPAGIGSNGLWIEGGKHVVIWQAGTGTFQVTSRLAGNVLIWVEGDRTFRLEGDLNKDQMLQLARDMTR